MANPSRKSAGSPQNITRAKIKAVHKVLEQDNFRKATETSFTKLKEVQGLDILERCKKFNEFLAKDLLGELEDDVLQQAGAFQHAQQRPAAAAVGALQLKGQPSSTNASKPAAAKPAAGHLKQPASSNPSQQPLASRITEKESEALLQLLAGEDVADGVEAQYNRNSEIAGGNSNTQHNSQQHAAHTPQLTAAAQPPVQTVAQCHADQQIAAASCSADCVAVTKGRISASDEDVLDVVGLLNSPINTTCLAVAAVAAPEPDSLRQAFAAVAIQRHVRGWLVRSAMAAQRIKAAEQQQAAICLQCLSRRRQAFRLLLARRLQQQQQQQRQYQHTVLVAGDSHQLQHSVSAAWQGYYHYWGQHAASTIQHQWRGYKHRQDYQQLRSAAVMLQAATRAWFARHHHVYMLASQSQQQQEQLLQQERQRMAQEQQDQHLQAAVIALQQCFRRLRAKQQLQQSRADVLASGIAPISAARSGQREPQLDRASVAPAATSEQSRARSSSSRDSSSRSSKTTSSSSGDGRQQKADRPFHNTDSKPRTADSSLISLSSNHDNMQQPPAASACSTKQLSACNTSERAESASRPSGPTVDADALMARGLVIRSAAETRIATQSGNGSEGECSQELARRLMHRADELQVGEGQQQADLATRTTLAASSFRKLQDAMDAVKLRRETS